MREEPKKLEASACAGQIIQQEKEHYRPRHRTEWSAAESTLSAFHLYNKRAIGSDALTRGSKPNWIGVPLRGSEPNWIGAPLVFGRPARANFTAQTESLARTDHPEVDAPQASRG